MQLIRAPLFSAVASLVLCTNLLADESNHTRSVESGKRFAVTKVLTNTDAPCV